jgi:hypothetical protein
MASVELEQQHLHVRMLMEPVDLRVLQHVQYLLFLLSFGVAKSQTGLSHVEKWREQA